MTTSTRPGTWPRVGRGSLVGTLVTKTPAIAAQAVPQLRRLARPAAGAGPRGGRSSPPATARRCRCSSTAARAAPAAAKNSAACAPSSTTCSAARCRARPPCWRPSPASTSAARAVHRDRGAPLPPPLRGPAGRREPADAPAHRRRGRHRGLRRHQRRLLLHALRRGGGQGVAFGKRIAHGYFVLSAAAGLFVSPAKGPVLANYGLDTLRFVKPVGIGDTIQARLTCKRKIDRRQRARAPTPWARAWWPGTWKSPTSTANWSPATTS
jgi:hypothetical protein